MAEVVSLKRGEAGLEFPKLPEVSKSLLAGKLLTHCIVNREAVSRTFKPLWRTQKPFHVYDVG